MTNNGHTEKSRNKKELTSQEIDTIKADFKNGNNIHKLVGKYHRHYYTLQNILGVKNNGRKVVKKVKGSKVKIDKVKLANRALDDSKSIISNNWMVLIYHGKERRFLNFNTREEALKRVTETVLRGGKAQLYLAIDFEVTAVIKGDV